MAVALAGAAVRMTSEGAGIGATSDVVVVAGGGGAMSAAGEGSAAVVSVAPVE